MTFPTAHSQVYRNEAGEVTGWDNPGYDDGPDPDEYYERFGQYDADQPDHQCDDQCLCTRQDADDEPEEPEPREPDDAEVSWQEYGRAEAYADGIHEQGYGE